MRSFSFASLATLTLATVLCLPHASAQDLTAQEIVDRALDTNTLGFQTGEVAMVLTIGDARGATRERRLLIRGMQENDQLRSLVRVTAPADQAGQSYLFRQNATGEDDVFVFMPALDDAPRRISGNSKNGSFMGTHFTYADLETRDLRDAEYTRAADEQIGDTNVYVVDAVPRPGVRSDYASVRLWVRKSDFLPVRTRFFDARGETLKTLFTEETGVDSGRTYVRRMTLRVADGGFTTILLDQVDFDVAVSPAEFTPQNLAN
jgi:hypothetical protein